jgi:hypothetical protein
VLAGAAEEDVGDSAYAGLGLLDEGIAVEGVAADDAVAVRGLEDLDGAIGGELVLVHRRTPAGSRVVDGRAGDITKRVAEAEAELRSESNGICAHVCFILLLGCSAQLRRRARPNEQTR